MQIKEPIYDGRNHMESAPTWSEFTQNTTFHGVRYIFDSSQDYKPRRILWTLCVCTAITLFFYQAVGRAVVYFKFNTNVGVNIVYDTQVEFPAVTICNQNVLRVSAVASMGMYPFIAAVYKLGQNPTENRVYEEKMKEELSHVDQHIIETFSQTCGHQLEDLIVRCTWKGRACNLSQDFTPVMTSLGICYTFNGVNKNDTILRKSSIETGATFGLKLVLNIQQYDYLKCPHTQAGIRLLLHDPLETPQVSDLSVSVAPGTHTQAGIKRKQIESLEAPYGTCIRNAISKSTCIEHKRLRAVLENCHCINKTDADDKVTYWVIGTPNCPLDQWFLCTFTTMPIEGLGSNCSVPCHRVQYDVELSNSQLSPANIVRAVFGTADSNPQKIAVQKDFLNAMETTVRNVEDVYDHDCRIFDRAVVEMRVLMNSLNTLASILSSSHSLSEHIGIGDIIKDLSLVVDSILPKESLADYNPNDLFTAGYYRMSFKYAILRLVDLFEDLHQFHGMVKYKLTPSVMNGLATCNAKSDLVLVDGYLNQTFSYFHGVYLLPYDTAHPRFPVVEAGPYPQSAIIPDKHTIACLNSVQDVIKRCDYLAGSMHDFVDIDQQYAIYIRAIDELYTDTWAEPEVVSMGCDEQCRDGLEVFNSTEAEPFIRVIALIQKTANITKSGMNFTQFQEEAAQLNSALSGLPQVFDVHSITNQCGWVATFLQADINIYNLMKASVVNVWKQIEPLAMSFNKIKTTFTSIQLTATKISSYTDRMAQYEVNRNSTKLQLARMISEVGLAQLLMRLGEHGETFVNAGEELNEILSHVKGGLGDAMLYAFTTKVPMFNDTILQNSTFWTRFVSPETDPYVSALVANFTQERSCVVSEVIEYVCDKPGEVIREIAQNVSDLISNMYETLSSVRTELAEYKLNCEMSDKFYGGNFMNLDIFYKELSYDLVEQTPAFEGMSFMSEIGGFLGLLLGASCLTVCELLDMFLIKILSRNAAKKSIYPADSLPAKY